jgi:hypothetical protein
MSEKETRREEELKRAAKKVHVNLMKVNKLYQSLVISHRESCVLSIGLMLLLDNAFLPQIEK